MEERTFQWVEFWYQNGGKIDSFISQLNGRIEGERKETVSKTVGGSGKLGFEIGGLLAALGLAKAKAEGELHGEYGKILEVTTSLSADNKVLLMLSFLEQQGQLAPVQLFDVEPAELLAAARRARFQLFMGGFTYLAGADGKAELRSVLAHDGEPLVRVPLLAEHFLPSQTINAVDGGDVFPHHVLCTSMPRVGWLLASPIAIWFPDVDPATDVLNWWTGRRTAPLDETGTPVEA